MHGIWHFKTLALGAVIGGLFLFVLGPRGQDWICYTDDGGSVFTATLPVGDLMVSNSGDRYSSDNVIACWENLE